VFGKPLAGSLPTIIGSFKSAVTKRAGAMVRSTSGRIWQRGYYERVVGTPSEYAKISRYIGENPLTWALDEENPRRTETYERKCPAKAL
jgi:putative transposase